MTDWFNSQDGRNDRDLEVSEAEFLLTGRYQDFRGTLGLRGDEFETHYCINRLRSLRNEYQHGDKLLLSKPVEGSDGKELLESPNESLSFFRALFRIMRAAGFGDEYRPRMVRYAEEVEQANESSPTLDSFTRDFRGALAEVYPENALSSPQAPQIENK